MKSSDELLSEALASMMPAVSVEASGSHEKLRGTTCLSIVNNSGVVVATDGRVTMTGETGPGRITSESINKICEVDQMTAIAIAGSLSAAQTLIGLIQAKLEFEFDKFDGKYIPPETKANIIKRFMAQGTSGPVMFLIGSYDVKKKRGRSCLVFPDGSLLPESDFDSIGSGSLIVRQVIKVFLDIKNKPRNQLSVALTLDEAMVLAVYALSMAHEDDPGTGFAVNMISIGEGGIVHVGQGQIEEIKKYIQSGGWA